MSITKKFNISALQEKYGLSYHIPYALTAEEKVGLRGKNILEVGGSLPRDFVIDDLGAKQWIAIEELEYYRETGVGSKNFDCIELSNVKDCDSLGGYAIISGRAERLTSVFSEKFDVVFSIAAFEHVDRLPMVLERTYQCLKPGGRLFTMFSPIWSAHDGHHLHAITDKSGKTFSFGSSPIPPWGHLLMRPPQMHQHLLSYTDADTAAEIVYHVYNSPSINRLFTEDYLAYFQQSAFHIDTIIGTFRTEPTEQVRSQLKALFPGRRHFGNNGLLVVLTKR